MSLKIVNVTFDHGGIQYVAGQVYDSTDSIVTLFPSNFSASIGTVPALAQASGTVDPAEYNKVVDALVALGIATAAE